MKGYVGFNPKKRSKVHIIKHYSASARHGEAVCGVLGPVDKVRESAKVTCKHCREGRSKLKWRKRK